MRTWNEITNDRGLKTHQESVVCQHVPGEESYLYHALDGGTTEWEFLNLLHALVLATKPKAILELGTYKGFGTLALAHAAAINGVGNLVTVDIEPCPDAVEIIKDEDLSHVVAFEKMEALHLCRDKTRKWDFVFVDSGGSRSEECQALIDGVSLNPHSIVCFHDASPMRSWPNSNQKEVDYLSKNPRTIRIHKSRGFEFFQV